MGTKITQNRLYHNIIIISLVSYSEWYSTALLVIIIFNSLSHLQLLDCAGEDDEPLSTTAPIATNKPIITTKSPLPLLDTLLMLYCTLTCVGNHVYLLDCSNHNQLVGTIYICSGQVANNHLTAVAVHDVTV